MKRIVERVWFPAAVFCALVLTAVACSKNGGAVTAAKASEAAAALTPDGLTAFQVEHGIGPMTSPVAVNNVVDRAMAKTGENVFEQKCSACHKMDERYVGPALGEVTKRRTPTFVMNMMLNPLEMVQKHPVSKKLLAEYLVAMPNQNLSTEQSRQVLEYLRSQNP